MNVIYPLLADQRDEIVEHLLQLSAEDRRLRFGVPTTDAAIEHYVERIDFFRDAMFGVRDDSDQLSASTHFAQVDAPGYATPSVAELGLSVRESHRGRGIAQSMFRRALLHARNRGIHELYVHCLSENAAMMRIARKAGMRVVIEGPERDAWLDVPAATPLSLGQELQAGQLVLLDWTLRTATRNARALSQAAGSSVLADAV